MSDLGLTLEQCRRYLYDRTFRLTPIDYTAKFPDWPGAVGIEVETLPIYAPTKAGELPRPVRLDEEGSIGVISRLVREKNWTPHYHEDVPGRPLAWVHMDHDDNITFEPGGQVEYSSAPHPCLNNTIKCMQQTLEMLAAAYKAAGASLELVGLNPWHSLETIGLQVKKARYREMDRHFAAISEYGQRMMRQTMTVQVNLDFGADETTLAKRYLVSQLIGPFAGATFSYSSVLENKLAPVPGFRTKIWRHADPSRTGFPDLVRVAKHMNRETCVDVYLDFAMNAKVVFLNDYKTPSRNITFGEWLAAGLDGQRPTAKSFETHLSLLFPEVRPRGFLEIRSIDAQPLPWLAVPAAYFCALLYDGVTMDRALELLQPYITRPEEMATKAVQNLADPEINKTAVALMRLAIEGYTRLPECFRSGSLAKTMSNFAETFTFRGQCPGDILAQRVGPNGLLYNEFVQLNELWTAAAKR